MSATFYRSVPTNSRETQREPKGLLHRFPVRGAPVAFLFNSVLALCLTGCGFSARERAAVESEKTKLAQAEKRFEQIQDEVNRDLKTDPGLFRAGSRDVAFPQRLQADQSELNVAKGNFARLEEQGKSGHHGKPGWVEQSIKEISDIRVHVLNDAESIEAEANRGLNLKRNPAATVREMEQEHQMLQSFDVAPVKALIARAETDWPDKKSDLDARLVGLLNIPAQSESAWESSAAARDAVGKSGSTIDYVALYTTEEGLRQASAELPREIDALKNLSSQLYCAWDKILEDLDEDRQGNHRVYDEKIKTIRTRLIDVAAKKSETSSEEKWDEISETTYKSLENDLGMTIEHKPAGKYDSEAEHVAQPAGFAYVASPEQGSNQYGYWEHRDGGSFWTFFPQYLLLRELLWGHSYRPIPTFEWEGYRTAQSRGQTYYGHDPVTDAPRYGSHGTFTATRYANSRYMQTGGGFAHSRYSSGSGAFGSSRYATGSGRSAGSFSSKDPAGHRFGSASGSGGSSGHRFGSSPSRSLGRSFGRHR